MTCVGNIIRACDNHLCHIRCFTHKVFYQTYTNKMFPPAIFSWQIELDQGYHGFLLNNATFDALIKVERKIFFDLKSDGDV